jgi:superfamily II DNA or RNA helicase
MFAKGQKIRLPGESRYVNVEGAIRDGDSWELFVREGTDGAPLRLADLGPAEVALTEIVTEDGSSDSKLVLAALWAEWMASATTSAKSAALASSTLRPYPHQHQAVYGAMLPQPMLRFLLGDEPGTGKTIMGGLYAREAQRIGVLSRVLVVCPAHLVTKWQADFENYLGGGLKRITSDTVKEGALELDHDFWVISLELAAVNPTVLEAIHPSRAGWDLVIFDEAHRLTPTAESYHRVGRVLALNCRRVLMMTATPHRGNEWLFRSLMHLVDPDVFPAVERQDAEEPTHRLKPGDMHFMRRMKEELFDYDGQTRLFNERHAENVRSPLSSVEVPFYQRALELVDEYFPDNAKTLGRIVYGKRAASSLHALGETLRRRRENMGKLSAPEARRNREFGDPFDDGDESAADHAEVIFADSKASKEEKRALKELLDQVVAHLNDPSHSSPADVSSKWPRLVDRCLAPNGIVPGNDQQVVVFTEYADTAAWLVQQFHATGYTADMYSGRISHDARDLVRARFQAGDFQVIVSTDAGNEGIDLQSAHVLVNWDIPWSLVTLEQRMGRIHRVGQKRDVWLYNLIATGTLEGETLARLLDRLVNAANELKGKMFDCLSLVGENLFNDTKATVPLAALFAAPAAAARAKAAMDAITEDRLRIEAEQILAEQRLLSSKVDLARAVEAIQDEHLERINPHFVERFLRRLHSSGLVRLAPSPLADEGLFLLEGTSDLPLPASLASATGKTLIATYGDAKTKAIEDHHQLDAARAIALGPAERPFRDLVRDSVEVLRPSLFRGGRVTDRTTTTDYWLFVYESDVVEGTTRTVKWRYLIRVDDIGARRVPFEMLSNLEAEGETSGLPHPKHRTRAHQCIEAVVEAARLDRSEVLREWNAQARRQLRRLPADLTRGIADAAERARIRDTTGAAVEARLAQLDHSTELIVADTRLVGWVSVRGSGVPDDPTEKDSETISMTHVRSLLEPHWLVADVSQEKLGYDLKARRGHLQRAVEVKGVWGSAASSGIELTAGEMARAGLLGDDYWLYVIDQCHDGKGSFFGAYQNPAELFADLTKDVPILRINGSDLKSVRDQHNAA